MVLILCSCVPVNSNISGAVSVDDVSSNVVLVAQIEETNIYKFQDGERTCYVTESNWAATASSAIWCTQ